MKSKRNLLQDMTQLISLDCSSITGDNFNLTRQFPYDPSMIKTSLKSLKSLLPSFVNQFNVFREQIIEAVYYTINKLMNIIKNKNLQISKLEQDLQKSQCLTNGMKGQVIQLKQMINQFVQSYSLEINAKDKEIQAKQKQLIQIKNVLKANFNSPSQFCKNCQISSCLCRQQMRKSFQNLQNISNFSQQQQQNQSFYIQQNNNNKKGQILIQMSQSILFSRQTDNLIPLQIIQEQGSDINSLTDYLHSQRISHTSQIHKNDLQQISSEIINSGSRNSLQNKKSQQTRKASTTDIQKNFLINNNNNNIKNSHLINQQPFLHNNNSQNKVIINYNNKNQAFPLSHIINKGIYSSRGTRDQNQHEITKLQRQHIQRRCSEQIVRSDIIYNLDENSHVISNEARTQNKQQKSQNNYQNNPNNHQIQQKNQQISENSFKIKNPLSDVTNRIVKNQNLSKSSSSSQLLHFGDTDRINLPKKFQSPKNMNFFKKNTTRIEQFCKEQRLKTQPSPRNLQYKQLNKQNIHIGAPNNKVNTQLGRKIFARKKNIKTHCIMNSSANKLDASLNEVQPPLTAHKPVNVFKASIISNQIHSQVQNSRSTNSISQPQPQPQLQSQPRASPINNFMSNSSHSNISTINQSYSKSHHEYYSAGKNIPTTPKSIKSMSKSKQKIKVTSKNNNNNKYLVDEFNNIKKNKGSVHLGMKTNLKKNLQDIKNSFKNYQININMKQIYYDGKYHNQLKQGKAKIIYENGIIFQGNLKAGQKYGQAKLILNGLQIFQGLYQNDKINGQGYLKSLKFISEGQCPKMLEDASYFGKFQNNKFDGMGTLFLNQKEKIVTKFKSGIPYGQLTYYTENDIEFGYWPTQ